MIGKTKNLMPARLCLLLHGLFVLWGPSNSALAQFPVIELRPFAHPAIQSSEGEVALVPRGENLEGLSEITIDGEGYHSRLPLASGSGDAWLDGSEPRKLELSLPGRPSPGLYQIRLRGRLGISNPRPLLITERRVRAVNSEEHSDSGLPHPVESSTIYQFAVQPQQKCFFQISLAAGDVLRCVAYARQLDSQTIPSMQLYGPRGSEIDRSRGLQSWPAEIEFQAATAGDYLLSVHDFLYRGGDNFACLIEFQIDSRNLNTSVSDSSTSFEATSSQQVISQPPSAELPELDRLLRPNMKNQSYDSAWKSSSNIITNGLKVPEISRASAAVDQGSLLPFSAHGSLRSGSQHFDLRLTSGQEVCVDVQSSAWQQLTDPRLIVYRVPDSLNERSTAQAATGQDEHHFQFVAENDDRPFLGGPEVRLALRDPYLQWTPAETGGYRIELSDLQAGKRPLDAMQYRLNVRKPDPSFQLLAFYPYPNANRTLARPTGSSIMRSGTLAIRVIVIRRDGFSRPIKLSVTGLPDDLSCQPSCIPSDASEAALIIQANDQLSAWSGPITIVGSEFGDVEDDIRRSDQSHAGVEALAATIWQAKTATRNTIQSRLTNSIYLSTTPEDQSPITVRAGDETVLAATPQSEVSIPIRLERRETGKVDCLLRPRDLPKYATMAELKIPADAEQATAVLQIAQDAPQSRFSFWIENEARIRWRKNPECVEKAEAVLRTLRDQLEATSEQAERKRLEKVAGDVEKQLEQLRKTSEARDITVWLPSNLIHVKITNKP